MARTRQNRHACRWCGYRAAAELKPSDPVIGPDLYECADVGHCVIRLRSKAKIVEVFGKDDEKTRQYAVSAGAVL